jgi:hypothetical protein
MFDIIQKNLPLVRLDQPYHHIESSGLARPVRAQQSDDLPLLQLDGHMIHHRPVVIGLYKVLGMNGHAQILLFWTQK